MNPRWPPCAADATRNTWCTNELRRRRPGGAGHTRIQPLLLNSCRAGAAAGGSSGGGHDDDGLGNGNRGWANTRYPPLQGIYSMALTTHRPAAHVQPVEAQVALHTRGEQEAAEVTDEADDFHTLQQNNDGVAEFAEQDQARTEINLDGEAKQFETEVGNDAAAALHRIRDWAVCPRRDERRERRTRRCH